MPTAYDRLQESKHLATYPFYGKYLYNCKYCPTAYMKPSGALKHLLRTHKVKLESYEKITNADRNKEL